MRHLSKELFGTCRLPAGIEVLCQIQPSEIAFVGNANGLQLRLYVITKGIKLRNQTVSQNLVTAIFYPLLYGSCLFTVSGQRFFILREGIVCLSAHCHEFKTFTDSNIKGYYRVFQHKVAAHGLFTFFIKQIADVWHLNFAVKCEFIVLNHGRVVFNPLALIVCGKINVLTVKIGINSAAHRVTLSKGRDNTRHKHCRKKKYSLHSIIKKILFLSVVAVKA